MFLWRIVQYVWALLWTSINKWIDDECLRYGASLSYYAVLSLAPLLVILVGLVGLFFGQGAAHAQLVNEAVRLAGDKAGALVDALLTATRRRAEGTTASLLALGLFVVGGTGVLVELREALDHIWMVPPPQLKERTLWATIRDVVLTRILTFGILFAIGCLLVASLLVSTFLTIVERWMCENISDVLRLATVFNPILSFVLLVLLFTILMRGLPSRRPRLRLVLPGAVIAALLFNVGKVLIGIYLGSTVTTSVYGAAGSLVALMIWVYYSSLIVLFGAEMAWVLYFTPRATMPGSKPYQRMYQAAFMACQRQIELEEDAEHESVNLS